MLPKLTATKIKSLAGGKVGYPSTEIRDMVAEMVGRQKLFFVILCMKEG